MFNLVENMDALFITVLAACIAYLLGSIPFAMLSSFLFGLADPRSYGSGNPGATNVLRSGHKLAAVLTLLGDAAKGALAILLARAFALPEWTIVAVALAVLLGHLFPLFLNFKGGKGVATAAGVIVALNPFLGLAALVLWLVTAVLFRYSSLSAVVATIGTPLLALWFGGATLQTLSVGLIAIILLVRHKHNLQRLWAGLEPKIGTKSAD